MNVPSIDHGGWGKLLAAVMETDPAASGRTTQPEPKVDAADRIRRREHIERTVVLEGGTDVYA